MSRAGEHHFQGRTLLLWLKTAALCAAIVAFIGCGKSNKYGRLPISGVVTLDGTPLRSGYLIFEPKGGQPVQSGGMIKDGRFEVAAEAGASPGPYAVSIFSGADGPVTKAPPGTAEYETESRKAPGERIPPKYNAKTILTAEVKSGEKNEFKFELTTK